jgi:hypothetical protein
MKKIFASLAALGATALTCSAFAATFPADNLWQPLTSAGQAVGDPTTDGKGNGREIVGCTQNDVGSVCETIGSDLPAVYVYNDGGFFFVRLRLNGNPEMSPGNLNSFGWGLLIDTDGDLNDYELSLLVNGISEFIELAANTTKTGVGDPSDIAETLVNDQVDNGTGNPPPDGNPDDPWLDEEVCGTPGCGNGRVTLACDAAVDTCFDGDDDYFLDFAIPLSYFELAGVAPGTPLVFWAGTSDNARSISVDLANNTDGGSGPGPGDLPGTGSDPIVPTALGCGPTSPDDDGDGLCNAEETANGTDPFDADSDDDGALDGDEPNWSVDSDGDGLINALDPDSDDDGLFDGTELGLDCSNSATALVRGHCTPDADQGATVTDPLDRDTDGGGVSDGSEDRNLNGSVETGGETDPTAGQGADDVNVLDSDMDGLGNDLELIIGSDPNDADSDDDGLIDGEESNPTLDSDGDGLKNPWDVDSDNDGLFDGTERGKDCSHAATDVSLGHCRADADAGATVTAVLNADTDDGGVRDGSEDFNLDGAVDSGETDPTAGQGADDAGVSDGDNDGLSDGIEAFLGSDPADGDSDDDGLLDGDEANPGDDHDGDGSVNLIDPDSDGDLIFDGTEVGNDCSDASTDASQGNCVADGDGGATTTGHLDLDTDDGGRSDGEEDANHNGVVDAGELDPNNPADDGWCLDDTECGASDGGLVCDTADTHACIPGCRGSGGNTCPDGRACSSSDDTIGSCDNGSSSGSSGSSSSSSGGGLPLDSGFFAQGDGCLCTAPGGHGEDSPRHRGAALMAFAAALALLRRRRQGSRPLS